MGPVKPATQMSATAPKSSRRETYIGKELLNIWKISGLSSKESHYTVASLGLAGDRQLLCRLREKYQGPLVLHLPLAMSMENDMYIAPLDRDSTVIGEISQHSPSNPLIQCYSSDLNNQSHIINGISILAGEQSKHISNIHAGVCFINPVSITADCSSLVTSHGKSIAGDASNPIENTEFQENLAGGMSITPSSLAAILAARIGLQENSAVFPPPLCLMGAPGPFFNNWQGNSNPLSATTFEDSSYNEVPGSSSKWNDNKFHKAPEIDVTGWTATNVAAMINHSYRSSNCSNELSLSLTTSTSPGHCSEVSCSDVTQCMNGTMPGLEQASCSSRELSVSLGGNKYVQFSPEVLGSRYLVGIQEILAQIARYSFENLERVNCSAAGTRAGGNKSTSAFPPRRRISMNHSANSMHETHAESPLQRHAAESKKSQLLTLLQLVESRYSQCLDEIHTVVSAFHAATELDPQLHAHFALQTISILYKDLRERISNHILAMGSNSNNLCSEENEWSFETSFLQKQWALQQLKRKDHQLWRPQRGLPERSVSVLRAWMFQNFLHPYPKDAEKHLLAVKSGLTRSQVSNWFINARVRLWKPMIEEMYTEMDKRKVCRNEGTGSSHGNSISLSNQN